MLTAHQNLLDVCLQGDHHEPLPHPATAAQQPHGRLDSLFYGHRGVNDGLILCLCSLCL